MSYQNVEGRNGRLWQDCLENNEATAAQQVAEWGTQGFRVLFLD
jgi:hypothetical protein